MKVQDRQNGPLGLPEKTGWLRAWQRGSAKISELVLIKKKKKRAVHEQISLCSGRIVETLATYHKLDSTIAYLQFLDLKIIFRFFCTVTAAATYK